VDVVDLGLTTTDMVYFASGKLNIPAVMITASHCTKELNGMKIVRAGAHVVGQGAGMEELRDIVVSGRFAPAPRTGAVPKYAILPEYIEHLIRFIDIPSIRPFKI